jgi:ribonuclease P protein component
LPSKRFTSDQRLRKAQQFKAVFAAGQRSRGSALTVICLPNTAQKARLGLAVAKRQIKRAVDRNRIKRNIREQVRLGQHRLPEVDLIFVAHTPAQKLSRKNLRAAVIESLTRAQKRYATPC